MNTILQKRIEEAAEKICCTDYPFESIRNCKECIEKENAIKTATFALQNQWISVEEGLPEEDIPNCFVAYKAMNMVLYSTGSYEKDNDEWYVDGVGFNVEVTHWMPIPSLEGGEE